MEGGGDGNAFSEETEESNSAARGNKQGETFVIEISTEASRKPWLEGEANVEDGKYDGGDSQSSGSESFQMS